MTDLHTENARLRAALEWYADSDNYETQYERLPCECCTDIFEPINQDRGERARTALATPAPDPVQEAARVLLDSEGRAHPRLVQIAEEQWDAGSSMSRCIGAALRAVAGGQP